MAGGWPSCLACLSPPPLCARVYLPLSASSSTCVTIARKRVGAPCVYVCVRGGGAGGLYLALELLSLFYMTVQNSLYVRCHWSSVVPKQTGSHGQRGPADRLFTHDAQFTIPRRRLSLASRIFISLCVVCVCVGWGGGWLVGLRARLAVSTCCIAVAHRSRSSRGGRGRCRDVFS